MNALHRHAERLIGAVAVIEAASGVIVRSLGEVVKGSIDQQIGTDVPRRRVAGASVGVRVQKLPAVGGVDRVLVKATGPLHLENNPTKPHSIAPKGPHPLAYQLNGRTVYTARVQHPGTRGKKTWQQGVDRAALLLDAELERQGVALLRKLL